MILSVPSAQVCWLQHHIGSRTPLFILFRIPLRNLTEVLSVEILQTAVNRPVSYELRGVKSPNPFPIPLEKSVCLTLQIYFEYCLNLQWSPRQHSSLIALRLVPKTC